MQFSFGMTLSYRYSILDRQRLEKLIINLESWFHSIELKMVIPVTAPPPPRSLLCGVASVVIVP